ncbi:Phytosulfokine receptor 2 [Camellia lanceoleosa]|uniref:Phytosulfokine receptor 2 n=1 Tax=Camellia lanceoleosa TaxID=1840588 RepID=A0ACC0GLD4_9ERIC|nr:Phytosulfokine receptor 2 [Camellia lanceoleosa]
MSRIGSTMFSLVKTSSPLSLFQAASRPVVSCPNISALMRPRVSLLGLAQLSCFNFCHCLSTHPNCPESVKLKNLEVLDFSHNMLTRRVSGSLVGLNSIRSINISCNSFNGNLFDLGEFPNLSVLNLSSNSFAGGLSSQICISSNKIQILDLSMNHLSGGLDGLGNCNTSLQQLRFDGNSLEGQILDSLYSASSLEHLSISANNFSGQLSPKLIVFSYIRKRLDAMLLDLDEKQNSKKDLILTLQPRIQSLQTGKAKKP